MISELELDRAFADKVASSDEFFRWVIEKTKFKGLAGDAVLLKEEQIKTKPRKKPENWWRHWWCELEDGSQSETDIFLVIGFKNSANRIAIHIEDKPPHGKFTPNQYLNYKRRAKFMANNSKFMNYSEFTTVLLAPKSFFEKNAEEVAYFDSLISYESVSEFIPIFRKSLQESNIA
jgi:hypothetical protein